MTNTKLSNEILQALADQLAGYEAAGIEFEVVDKQRGELTLRIRVVDSDGTPLMEFRERPQFSHVGDRLVLTGFRKLLSVTLS